MDDKVELKIKTLPVDAKLPCKFQYSDWVIGYLVRSSIHEYSLVEKNHVTRLRFKVDQIKPLYNVVYILIEKEMNLPKDLDIVNRNDMRKAREVASLRLSRQAAVMKSRTYANEIKIPIEVGYVVALKKSKKSSFKMSTSHDYLVVLEKKSFGNGMHTKFKLGNPYIGVVKNWISENEVWYVTNKTKLAGKDLDDYFMSAGMSSGQTEREKQGMKLISYSSKRKKRGCSCIVGTCSDNKCSCFRAGRACTSFCHPGKVNCTNAHSTVSDRIQKWKCKARKGSVTSWKFPHKDDNFSNKDSIKTCLYCPRIAFQCEVEDCCIELILTYFQHYDSDEETHEYDDTGRNETIKMLLNIYEDDSTNDCAIHEEVSLSVGNMLKTEDIEDLVQGLLSSSKKTAAVLFLRECMLSIIVENNKFVIIDPGTNGLNQPLCIHVSECSASVISLIATYGLLEYGCGDQLKAVTTHDGEASFDNNTLLGSDTIEKIPMNNLLFVAIMWKEDKLNNFPH